MNSQFIFIVTIYMENVVLSQISLINKDQTTLYQLYELAPGNRFAHFNYEELATPEVETFNVKYQPENIATVNENVTINFVNLTVINENIANDPGMILTGDMLNYFYSMANATLEKDASENVTVQEAVLKWYLMYINNTKGNVVYPTNVGKNNTNLTRWHVDNYIVPYILNLTKNSQQGPYSLRNKWKEITTTYNAETVIANDVTLSINPQMSEDFKYDNAIEAAINEYEVAKKNLARGKLGDYTGNISDSDVALINKFKERYKRNKFGITVQGIGVPNIQYSNKPAYPDPGGGWPSEHGNRNVTGDFPNRNPGRQYSSMTKSTFTQIALNAPIPTQYTTSNAVNSTIHQDDTNGHLGRLDHTEFPIPTSTKTEETIPNIPPNPPPNLGSFPTIPHLLPTITNGSSITTNNSAHHQEDSSNYLENSHHPGFPLPAYTETSEYNPIMGIPPNPPPYPGINFTIPNSPPTPPSPFRTTQYISPDQENSINPSENTGHPEFPIAEYAEPSGTTQGDGASPKLPLHPTGYPGHTVTTTHADPEWPVGSLIGGVHPIPATTTVSPFVNVLVDDMKSRGNGYLSTFLIKLFEILATKRQEDLQPLLFEMELTVNRLFEQQHMTELGEPLTSRLVKFSRFMTIVPPDVIQSKCSLLYYYLTHRRLVMSPDTNAIIDHADALFRDHEGLELFQSLESVKAFPNTTHSARELAMEVIDEVLLEPFKRTMGTEKKKSLLDNINKALLTHFPFRRLNLREPKYLPAKLPRKPKYISTDNNNKIDEHKLKSIIIKQHKKSYKINTKVQHINTKYPMIHKNYFKLQIKDNKLRRAKKKAKKYFRKQNKHDRQLSHIYEYHLRNNMLTTSTIASVENNIKINHKILKNNKNKSASYKISRKVHEKKYSRLNPVTAFINAPLNVKFKKYFDRIPQTSYKAYSYHRSTKIYKLNYLNSDNHQILKKNIAQESSYSDESKWIKLNLYKALRYGNKKVDAIAKRVNHLIKNNKIDHDSSYSDEETVIKRNIYKVFENISHSYK